MHRRDFLQSLGAATITRGGGPPPPRSPLPNIVYVLADDLGWGDLRSYNKDSAIPTPNADKLASQGVRFTDMHSPSAVCTPTRYGILTGRYCWRSTLKSGVLNGYSPNLIEPGRTTVASMLQSRGYYTGAIGKWHLGFGDIAKVDYSQTLRPGPPDHGFNYFFGIPASLDMEPYLYVENDRTVEQATATTEGRNDPRGVFWRGGAIAPGFQIDQVLPTLTAKAEAFIRERAGKPFFLYLPLTGPHTPWMPLTEYRNRSGAGIYGDFVTQVDDTLGRVMRAVDQAGVAGNTLFIFTSDNGAHWTPADKEKFTHRSNAGWRGMKADIWDAGHRIPFIVRWPGMIPRNRVSGELGCLTDFMATAAAVTGAPLTRNAAEDSYNLLPAMRAQSRKPIREAIVHHSSMGMFSIRQGEWKLALGLGSGGFSEPREGTLWAGEPKGQLYRLSMDPGETQNVYQKHPEVVSRLTELLERYRSQGYSRPI